MQNLKIPTFALVGGFLGAGKTTLIMRAATLLQARGIRVAVIMNDQDSGLVDTRLSEAHALNTREVAGGCFCCRLSDLLEATDELMKYQPQVIFAEPVGSCIDLSATILQPLKAYHRDHYRLAPHTVLVDPALAKRVYDDQADSDLSFLFRKQVAEADLLCAGKLDVYPASPDLPVPVDFQISAATGEGVVEWLDEVLNSRRVVGARVLDVDYNRYAQAEAALGWLNVHAEVELDTPSSPALLVGPLLDELDRRLTASEIQIAHLKVFDQTASGYVKASVCDNRGTPWPEGDLVAAAEPRHELVVNLRALGDPDRLQAIVQQTLAGIPGEVTVRHARAFRPSPPTPQQRFSTVVSM